MDREKLEEIDRLIHEKVMASQNIESCPTCGYDGHWSAYVTHNNKRPPFYSTDIAAAWLVVEKMHSHPKPVLMLAAPQQDYVGEKWRAEFCRKWWDEKNPYEYKCSADTAPLAICLAALRAVGFEI